MTRSKSNTEEPDIPPSVDFDTGIGLLKKQRDKIDQILKQGHLDSAVHSAWETTTREYLIKIFGSKSGNINDVIYANSDISLYVNMEDREMEEYRLSLIKNQGIMLDGCIEQLETEIALRSNKPARPVKIEAQTGNKVFIVHGQNSTVKENLARFIAKLGLTPVILHEQPNIGRTLIEKFIDYSDVSFAIVILTADDGGAAKDKMDTIKPRARQNVVFELGFFIGKLGRAKVCALYDEGVELPSDYDGVVYIPLDTREKWKHDLLKELKASGFDIDANKLYE